MKRTLVSSGGMPEPSHTDFLGGKIRSGWGTCSPLGINPALVSVCAWLSLHPEEEAQGGDGWAASRG